MYIQELSCRRLKISAYSTIFHTKREARLVKPRSSACLDGHLQSGHSNAFKVNRFLQQKVITMDGLQFPNSGLQAVVFPTCMSHWGILFRRQQ